MISLLTNTRRNVGHVDSEEEYHIFSFYMTMRTNESKNVEMMMRDKKE